MEISGTDDFTERMSGMEEDSGKGWKVFQCRFWTLAIPVLSPHQR